MAGSVNKDQLIDMLYFPRQLVLEELTEVVGECPHELRFACDDTQCLTCDLEDECRWLSENDDFAPLHLRSISKLVGALDAAILYVRGDAISWGHENDCACQVCEWLLRAQKMYDSIEVSADSPVNKSGAPVEANHIRHQPSPFKTPGQESNFWRFQSMKNRITRLTNIRIHLLRNFQPK